MNADPDRTWHRLADAMLSLRDLERERAEIVKRGDEMVTRIYEWQAERLGDIPQRIVALRAAIEEEGARYLADTGRKTIDTPWGALKARTAAKWTYADDTAALNALAVMGRGDLVRTRIELDKPALKKAATVLDDGRVLLDGEVLDGITAPTETTYTLTINGDPET